MRETARLREILLGACLLAVSGSAYGAPATHWQDISLRLSPNGIGALSISASRVGMDLSSVCHSSAERRVAPVDLSG